MSHITTVDVQVTDVAVLYKVCQQFGLHLDDKKKTYRTYGGVTNSCEACIYDPDNESAYEIGLVKKGDHYTVNYDDWRGGKGMMEKVGKGCGRLMQRYSIETAKKQARKLGWSYSEVKQEDGSIHLQCMPQGAW